MGEAKRRREAALLPFRPGLDGDVTDRVCQGDHEWFEANPNRKYRFRPALAGENIEAFEPGRFHYCIVTRLGPGLRTRTFVHFATPLGAPPEPADAAIRALLHRLHSQVVSEA